MPFEQRSIQDYGVMIDNIHYYHDVLRPWINATEPNNPKVKRKFLLDATLRTLVLFGSLIPKLVCITPFHTVIHRIHL